MRTCTTRVGARGGAIAVAIAVAVAGCSFATTRVPPDSERHWEPCADEPYAPALDTLAAVSGVSNLAAWLAGVGVGPPSPTAVDVVTPLAVAGIATLVASAAHGFHAVGECKRRHDAYERLARP